MKSDRDKKLEEILEDRAKLSHVRPQTAKAWKRPLAEIDYAIGWDLQSVCSQEEDDDDDAVITERQQDLTSKQASKTVLSGREETGSVDSGIQSPSVSSSRSSGSRRKRIRDSGNLTSRVATSRDERVGSLDSGRSSLLSSPLDRIQSVPDLASGHLVDSAVQTEAAPILRRVKTARACLACDIKEALPRVTEKQRNEETKYKYAFLCGKPGNNRPQSVNPATLEKYKKLRVRHQWGDSATKEVPSSGGGMKKSHSINTLAPPFSTFAKLTPHDIPTRLNTIYNISYNNSSKLVRGPSLNRLYKY